MESLDGYWWISRHNGYRVLNDLESWWISTRDGYQVRSPSVGRESDLPSTLAKTRLYSTTIFTRSTTQVNVDVKFRSAFRFGFVFVSALTLGLLRTNGMEKDDEL